MIGFVEFLIAKGFSPYRKVGDKYIKDLSIGYYSSTMPDCCDIRLKRGKQEVVYGLHEYKHPPTLIYPRPKGVVFDYQMDRVFQTTSFEELYKILKLERM